MFTGLVESIGAVVGFSRKPDGAQLEISASFAGEIQRGESIAVEGTCLTAVVIGPATFTADVSNETLARTTLGRLGGGSKVNLERSLKAGDRMGGHYVLGHVDVTARIVSIDPLGSSRRIEFELPREIAPFVVEKGSITVDGISLTINGVSEKSFWVAVIPETQERTTLGGKRAGELVNLEGDILGKYVLRALAVQKRGGVDEAFLARHGYL
jgi:riboflavin synthase